MNYKTKCLFFFVFFKFKIIDEKILITFDRSNFFLEIMLEKHNFLKIGPI